MVLHLGNVGIGAHVVRAARIDPWTSRRRDLFVRLSCTLFWKYAGRPGTKISNDEDMVRWCQLEAWRKVPARHCKEVKRYLRDAIVEYLEPHPAGTDSSASTDRFSHIVNLLDARGHILLALDFGDDQDAARDWHN
jgi:hypothetical protein